MVLPYSRRGTATRESVLRASAARAVILLDLALPTASGLRRPGNPQEFSRDGEHSGRGYQCVRHARRELCLAGRVGVRPEALRHRRPRHPSEAGTENGRGPAGTQGTNLCVDARGLDSRSVAGHSRSVRTRHTIGELAGHPFPLRRRGSKSAGWGRRCVSKWRASKRATAASSRTLLNTRLRSLGAT